MPYNSLNDLPNTLKNKLPVHAQEIYLQAFNHAFDEYKNPSTRKTVQSREQVAHKVAWAAVKSKYIKNNEQWIEKNNLLS